MENSSPYAIPSTKKRKILQGLLHADRFENFLKTKWTTAKRFGVEGGETLIPALELLVMRASELGVHNIVVGMPHRGR